MNIFVLSNDPTEAAQGHCDKHVVKMILEYAQLLSTAHRCLDGRSETLQRPNGKKQVLRVLPSESIEFFSEKGKYIISDPVCYGATHVNHPAAIWARQNGRNYLWLVQLLDACLTEYTHRYHKVHKTSALLRFFIHPPKNMVYGEQTPFPQTMPEEYKVPNDPVAAYQNYYVGSKASFAKWTNREVPTWFKNNIKDYNASNFERTTAVD